MGYTEQFSTLIKSIQGTNRLNYFKKELLKVLDSKEEFEGQLSKSIDSYFKNIEKTMHDEYGLEKGRVGAVGEIRTWKDGKKYKKMPNGNWVRVYQHQDRSAEISIARLKGKVRNAKSVDELMTIVMANIHRFEDENGHVLPIVEELKKEVDAGKSKINNGKPSTQQQIEAFKNNNASKKRYVPSYIIQTTIRNNEKYVDSVSPEKIKIGDYIVSDGWTYSFGREILEVKNIEKDGETNSPNGLYKFTDQNGETHTYRKDTWGTSLVSKIKDDAVFEENPLNKAVDVYKKILHIENKKECYSKLQEIKTSLENYRKEINDKIDASFDGDEIDDLQGVRLSIDKLLSDVNHNLDQIYWKLPEQKERILKESEENEKVYNGFRARIKEIDSGVDYAKKKKERLALIKEINNVLEENNKKIEEINNNSGTYHISSMNGYLQHLIKKLRDSNKKEAVLIPEVKQKNEELLFGKKEYSPEEIEKATNRANEIKLEMKDLAVEARKIKKQLADGAKKRMSIRYSDNKDEYERLKAEADKLRERENEIFEIVKQYSEELDTHLDVIIDDIINKEVKHDTNVDNLTTSESINEYMVNNGFFEEGSNSSLTYMDPKLAKRVFGVYERFFNSLELKGKLEGTKVLTIDKNAYAQVAPYSTAVEINKTYFKNEKDFDSQMEFDILSGFHPKGPHEQIVVHELAHVMVHYTKTNSFRDMAELIKGKVLDKYKVKGMKKTDIISKHVSRYATKNADEFCAEAFARGFLGTEKNNICRDVVKEFVKAINYLGGLY